MSVTWQHLFSLHSIDSSLWLKLQEEAIQAKCFAPIFQKNWRTTIEVGVSCTHKTLRSALDVANQYDRILIHPGEFDGLNSLHLLTFLFESEMNKSWVYLLLKL